MFTPLTRYRISETRNPEPGTKIKRHATRTATARSLQPETLNPAPDTRNPTREQVFKQHGFEPSEGSLSNTLTRTVTEMDENDPNR